MNDLDAFHIFGSAFMYTFVFLFSRRVVSGGAVCAMVSRLMGRARSSSAVICVRAYTNACCAFLYYRFGFAKC